MNINVIFPIFFAVAIVVFVAIARSKRVKKANYDERQLLARNTACKNSFFFLLIYCFTCGLLYLFDIHWANTAIQMFLGVILSFTLFIALCIIKDAYFSNLPKYNTNSVIFFFSYGVLSIIYLLNGLGKGKTLMDNGVLSELFLYLVSSVCFWILGIISVIKLFKEKRGAEK